MAAPKWFETTTYFNNKLAQMQRDEPEGNWTADSLTAAFEEGSYNVNSADSMYTHFEQYGNTATERVSPNQYFDNDYYMNSKLAQMQATNPGYTMAQLETAMFAEGNMSPWTHYTLYGITEGIDPSAGFNTKEYMAAKLAQMQAEYPDENWTMDSLFEAFRAGNLNPIEHYFEYGVTENLDFTPGGVTPGADLTPVELTAGQDVIEASGIPTNYIGTVEASQSKSTLNPNDQINGGNDADTLTVTMNANFSGMNRGGFVKDVANVDIENATHRDLNFNTRGIEGAETYNIDGAVNLANVEKTGITVNYNDVHTTSNLTIGFAQGVNSGPDDSLTIGLNDVYIPSNGKDASGNDQPAQHVSIVAQAIEDLTINSTGAHTNIVNLDGANYMRSLAITGDAKLDAEATGTYLKSVDGSEATGDITLGVYGDRVQLADVKLGAGNDTLYANNISATASLEGGEGNDNLVLVGAHNNYALNTESVETLTLANTTASSIGIIGENMDGLENLVLNNVSDYRTNGVASSVTLASFPNSELNVQAVNRNFVDLTIAEIPEVNVRVGDGDSRTADGLIGSISLGQATSLNITADDGLNRVAGLNATVKANQVSYMDINATVGSTVALTGPTDLSALTNVEVSGGGNVTLGDAGSAIGSASRSVYVNTQNMSGGNFSADFANNTTTGGAALNVQGSNLANHNIKVDSSYQDVDIVTGMGNDVFTLNGGGDKWNSGKLNVDLGGGSNTAFVYGKVVGGSDFSGIKGVSVINFQDYTATELDAAGIIVGEGVTARPYQGKGEVPDYVPSGSTVYPVTAEEGKPVQFGSEAPVENLTLENTTGNTNSYQGQVAKGGSLAISGNTGGVKVNFGDTVNDVQTNNSESVVITGGDKTNTITGTVKSVDNASITTGTKDDTVDLTVAQTAGQSTTINNTAGASGEKFAVEVKGAGETTVTSADFNNVIVAAAATGNTTLVAAEGTTAPVAVNVEGGATTTVQANNASKVALNVSGGEEIIVAGAASGQTTEVTGTIGEGAENTDFTLKGNGGNFIVDGEGMSALSNLTVSGAGDTTVTDLDSTATSFDLTTDGNVTFEDTTLNSVKTFTVDATGAESAVVVQGGIANSEAVKAGTETEKYVGLYGVENLNVESDGVVNFTMQLGKASSGPITVDATKCDGGLVIEGAGFCSKGGTFNGGKGDDSVVVSVQNGDYSMNFGGGADELVVLTSWSASANDVAKMTVSLGEGADTISLWGQKGAGNHDKGGAYITVTDFKASEGDKLAVVGASHDPEFAEFQGGAYVTWTSDLSSDASKILAFIKAFDTDSSLTEEAVKGGSANGNCLTIGEGADAVTYVAFITNDGGSSQAIPSGNPTVNGCALIELQGVAISTENGANAIFAS